VTLSLAPIESAATIVANPDSYTSTVASLLRLARRVSGHDVDGKAILDSGLESYPLDKLMHGDAEQGWFFTAIETVPEALANSTITL